MKKLLCLLLIITIIFTTNIYAKQIEVEKNTESIIMLDIARRYYTVDEIKQYIDVLSQNENSSLQLHMTDNENVGIECTYLDQTKDRATYSNGIYTNPDTGRKFLTYDQLTEIMNYAKEKKVEFIPEIDVPAHMKGFFDLAEIKFGYDFVHHPFDWDVCENSGIGWGTGDEAGHIDLKAPNAKIFIKALYDEYTEFFKDCKYFFIGFDEYTFRPEMKIDYANELYDYLSQKGFTVRMWSDAITKDNIDDLNNNIEIVYWGWKQADITLTNYATVPDLQDKGFKVIITNKFYLFFVPSSESTTDEALARTVNNIENSWTLEKWNYNFDGGLNDHNNVLGGMVCVWGEHSAGITSSVIFNQTKNMYNAMFPKLDKIKTIIDVPDDPEPDEDETEEDVKGDDTVNPKTGDNIYFYIITLILSTFGLGVLLNVKLR